MKLDSHVNNTAFEMSSKNKIIRLIPEQNSFPMVRCIAEFERLFDLLFAVKLYSDYGFQNQTALIDFVGPRLLEYYKFDQNKISTKRTYEYFDRISPSRIHRMELSLAYSKVVDVFLVYLKDMISLSIYSEPTKFAGNKQLPISEILKHGSLDSLIEQYVIGEIERVSYSDIREMRKLLSKCDFATVLKPRDYERIQTMLKVRNRLVHGDGIGELVIAQSRRNPVKRESISQTKFNTDYRFMTGLCKRIDQRAMKNRAFLRGIARAFPGIFSFNEND